jgi:hypothetical protein
MKYDVFGTLVTVIREGNRWAVYYPGPDGKRRPAADIAIPPDLADSEIAVFLADLCHEWASQNHPSVRNLG